MSYVMNAGSLNHGTLIWDGTVVYQKVEWPSLSSSRDRYRVRFEQYLSCWRDQSEPDPRTLKVRRLDPSTPVEVLGSAP